MQIFMISVVSPAPPPGIWARLCKFADIPKTTEFQNICILYPYRFWIWVNWEGGTVASPRKNAETAL